MANTLIVHEITKGDLRTPLMIVCQQGGKPLDWANGTKAAAFFMVDANGNSVVAPSSTGVTTHPTFSFTVDTTYDRVIRNDHVVREGDQLIFANSGGALPTGLSAATRYFAKEVSDNFFKLSLTRGGGGATTVDITGAGSGTNTFYIVGSIQKEFLAADVDTAGDYYGWFTCSESSELDTFPNDGRKLLVRIIEAD